jgi:hypothetical protein
LPDEAGEARVGLRRPRLDRGAAALGGGRESRSVRTVMTFLASDDCTVCQGVAGIDRRTKVSGDSTPTMSEICATSSSAATRGITFLPLVVAGARAS